MSADLSLSILFQKQPTHHWNSVACLLFSVLQPKWWDYSCSIGSKTPHFSTLKVLKCVIIFFFLLQSRACFSSGVRRWWKNKHEAEFHNDMWEIKDLLDEPVFFRKTSLTLCFWKKKRKKKKTWEFSTPPHLPLTKPSDGILWLWSVIHHKHLRRQLLEDNSLCFRRIATACLCFWAWRFVLKRKSREWRTLVISCYELRHELLPPRTLMLTAFSTDRTLGVSRRR